MITRAVEIQSPSSIVAIFIGITLFILALGGCASPTPVTGPGTPDETQLKHCKMLLSAIEAESKVDALAALDLLQADVSRGQAAYLNIVKFMADHEAVSDAVNKEDWALANKEIEELKAYYGHECEGSGEMAE
jgi:hypothetical protein